MIRKKRFRQDEDFAEESINEETETEGMEEEPKKRWSFFKRKSKKEELYEEDESIYAPLSDEEDSYNDEEDSYADREDDDEYKYSYDIDSEEEVKEYEGDEYRFHYGSDEDDDNGSDDNSDYKYDYADNSEEEVKEYDGDEYRFHYADDDSPEYEEEKTENYEYDSSVYRYVYSEDEEEYDEVNAYHAEEDIEEDTYEDIEDEEEEEDEDDDDDDFGFEKKKISKRLIIILAIAIVAVIAIIVFAIRNLSGGSDGEAYVESVELIAGLGSANGMNNRYTGEVEPQDSWKITLDGELSVDKCYVAVGDLVKKGDKLFSYDTEEVQLSLERQELEVETLKNENTQLTKDIATYENDVKTATASEKIELQTQILTAQTTIKKNEFSIKSAEDEIKKLKENIKDATVTSKMDGVVNSLNEKLGKGSSNDDSDSGTESGDTSYMTILATGDYRVKGTINETNVWLINEGDPVIIRSRIDDSQTWSGTINKVKTDSTADSGTESSDTDYGVEGGEKASKYNFYVTLESDEGLMMGQHVFVELDNGQDDEKNGIWIPTSYLNIDGDDFYVWKDSKGKLKKEKVDVGDYNELLDEYEILSGVSAEDYIACDDVTLEENMKTTKTMPTENVIPEGDTGALIDGGDNPDESINSDGGEVDGL